MATSTSQQVVVNTPTPTTPTVTSTTTTNKAAVTDVVKPKNTKNELQAKAMLVVEDLAKNIETCSTDDHTLMTIEKVPATSLKRLHGIPMSHIMVSDEQTNIDSKNNDSKNTDSKNTNSKKTDSKKVIAVASLSNKLVNVDMYKSGAADTIPDDITKKVSTDATVWKSTVIDGATINMKNVHSDIVEYLTNAEKKGINIKFVFSGELTKFASESTKTGLLRESVGTRIYCHVYNKQTALYTFIGYLTLIHQHNITMKVDGGTVVQSVFYFGTTA